MRLHLSAQIFLPQKMERIECLRSATVAATLTFFLFVPYGHTVADELKTPDVAALFAADEDVLSKNTDVVVRRALELPVDQQFDYLATWVLPSTTRSAFRMKATFVQTDPAPIEKTDPLGSTIDGIRTPVFLLLEVAQQSNRMDELRRRVAALDDPPEPHALRAKHAMLFMIDSANQKHESATESLAALSTLVRTRGENLDERWWPETLALAFGLTNEISSIEMLDLATSIHNQQIGQSIWSGNTAWDIFIAGAYARLSGIVDDPAKSEPSIRNDFEHWRTATVVTAKSRGGGCPTASWQAAGNAVRDGECRHFLNGRLILKRTLTPGEYPWIALRADRLSHGSIRNLTITGTPQVPATVQMVTSAKLVGWFSYFDEVADDENDSFSWRSVQTTEGVLEIQHASAPEFSGTVSENLLMYHRPMLEDGAIEYEFYYVPGETIVHPAIDRLVFLLEADGIKTHWVTDRQYQRDELQPDNQTAESQTKLSLKANEWNLLQLVLKDDVVQIRLNGNSVLDHPIVASNQRQFGLFHFSDATSVRVRNIRWTGNWPNATDVPEMFHVFQKDTVEIEKATAALPIAYQMEFQSLQKYTGHFIQRGGPITVENDGVVTESVSEKGERRTDLPLWFEVGGDFDLRASFQDFRHADVGDGGLEFLAYLPREGQKIRIARHRWDNKEHKMRTRLSSMTEVGQEKQRAVDHWSVNDATSGTFRMVRLGSTVYYMFAEGDSTIFRVLSTDEVGRGPLNAGGAGRESEVCLKSMKIHAENF